MAHNKKKNPAPKPTKVKGKKPANPTPWIEKNLIIPTGALTGSNFKLEPFQKKFIREAWKPRVSTAVLSVGRGNGKSGLAAGILIFVLKNNTRFRGAVACVDRPSAEELAEAVDLCCQDSGIRARYIKSKNQIVFENNGSILHILSSDRAGGLAKSLDIVVCDELAYWHPNKAEKLFNALRTAAAKRANSKLLAISTQGDPEGADNQLERLKKSADVVHVYAADEKDDPASDKAIKAANPGIGTILPWDGIRKMRDEALKDPASMRGWKAFHLNLPTMDVSSDPLLSPEQWKSTLVEELPAKQGQCYAGLDLGGAESMTGLVLYWPETGRLQSHGFFCNKPDLLERGKLDGVGRFYQDAYDTGEISLAGSNTVDLDEVLDWIEQEAPGATLLGDAFRSNELAESLEDRDLYWEGRRTSYLVAQADIRRLWQRIADGLVKSVRSRIMAMGLKGARLTYDTSGNPKLDKRRKLRIDIAQALIMCMAGVVLFGDGTPEEGDFGGW